MRSHPVPIQPLPMFKYEPRSHAQLVSDYTYLLASIFCGPRQETDSLSSWRSQQGPRTRSGRCMLPRRAVQTTRRSVTTINNNIEQDPKT